MAGAKLFNVDVSGAVDGIARIYADDEAHAYELARKLRVRDSNLDLVYEDLEVIAVEEI